MAAKDKPTLSKDDNEGQGGSSCPMDEGTADVRSAANLLSAATSSDQHVAVTICTMAWPQGGPQWCELTPSERCTHRVASPDSEGLCERCHGLLRLARSALPCDLEPSKMVANFVLMVAKNDVAVQDEMSVGLMATLHMVAAQPDLADMGFYCDLDDE